MAIKAFSDRGKRDVGRSVLRSTTRTLSGALTPYVDKFRQGVSIRTLSHYYLRSLPRLMSADPPTSYDNGIDHGLEICNYGQPKLFTDPSPDGTTSPFEDLSKFNAKNYILDRNYTEIYPSILLNPSLNDPSQMDGVIEPLSIRETLSNTSTGTPFIAHTVRGDFIGSSPDFDDRGAAIISQRIDFKSALSVVPFEDGQERLIGNVAAPGFVSEKRVRDFPFDDSQRITHISESFSFLTGSNRDRGRFGKEFKSSTSGFIFNSTTIGDTTTGTDSLAFGGMKR